MLQNRYVRYFIFACMLLAADIGVGYLLGNIAKKQIRDNRVGLLIENKIPADIYILGSSRALNNFSPGVISKHTNKTCYNLGVSGSNILFHETLLDLILLQENKPELIIYNIDDHGSLFTVDGIVYRKDLLYPYVDNLFINKKVNHELKRKNIATRLSSSYRQNVNFMLAMKYLVSGKEEINYKTNNLDSTGANLLDRRPADPLPVFNEGATQLLPGSVNSHYATALKRIQQKCIDNQIKIILILPPLYKTPTPGFKDLIQQQILDGAVFTDLSTTIQEQKYFFNKDHMVREGAELYSEIVANSIIRNY